MAQTLTRLLTHIVFSTKDRRPWIRTEIESELYRYTRGTLSNLHSPCIEVNGTEDHLHFLTSQDKNISVSQLLCEVKKSSSKWIKTRGRELRDFQWQDGYAAFSVNESHLERVRRYLARQKQHHRRMSFQEELLQLLTKHRVQYDQRYLWD
jgi:REP-associated tyrosine transposase